MKVKTITCHNIYNYGASLQAYALLRYLRKIGSDSEIIDYRPDYLSRRLSLSTISPKWRDRSAPVRLLYKMVKFPARFCGQIDSCKYAFDRFSRKHLRVTGRRFQTYSDLLARPPEADAYIAGSDQIWNSFYPNGRDPSFYLGFVPEGRPRIAYAASFSANEIAPGYEDFVREAVSRIDHISVREKQSVNLLSSLGIERAVHVLDPVFLLGRDDWASLGGAEPEEPYLAVYDMERRSEIEQFAKDLARKKGLKIYGLNNYGRTPYADRDFYRHGPENFLSVIKNSEAFIGNSFHGLAFAILFEKEFVGFKRIDRGHERTSHRLDDLANTFGIEGRIFDPRDAGDAHGLPAINYAAAGRAMAEMRRRSEAFLARALTN